MSLRKQHLGGDEGEGENGEVVFLVELLSGVRALFCTPPLQFGAKSL